MGSGEHRRAICGKDPKRKRRHNLRSESGVDQTQFVLFWLCVLLGFVFVFVCPHLRS